MKKLFKLIILFLPILNFAQSKKLWIISADDAFKKKDYASAAYFYAKVLDDTTVLEQIVLPYETQLVNLKLNPWVKVPEWSLGKQKKDTNQIKSQKAIKISNYDLILYKLGLSYLFNKDYKHAVSTLKECSERKVFADALYYYGIALMNNKKYDQALKIFEEYNSSENASDSLKLLATKFQSSCFFGIEQEKKKREITVFKADTNVFNKGTSNFAPMYYMSPDKILFTSARKGNVVNDPEKEDPEYLCDIYWTEKINDSWIKPVNVGKPVNTAMHEGAAIVTPDEVMLFTRWSDFKREDIYIYAAKMNNGKFYESFKLNQNVNIPGYKSMHPFVTMDGRKLFFSSNRPGGLGGMDIWVCEIDEDGVIGPPKNLGHPVNTIGDEVTPFFHQISQTLFFSSNGHPGMGGLDIFKSHYDEDNSTFEFPKNLGMPINSAKDDAYFIMDKTQYKGFFSSDREPCEGGHCYDIYEFINEPIIFDLKGYVYDAETNEPIPSALVTIKDVHGDDEPLYVITDEKGYYFTELKPDMEYFLKAQKNKYFAQSANLATKGKTETTHFEQDFYLNKIPAGEIEIEGIEYDFDKATLRPKSKEVLDKIVELLNLNDNISIEINAHTDSRGNDKYNLKLSKARAQSCVDYLISKGISKNRLKANGFGESQPLIPDEEINKLTPKSPEWEAAHQKNRRTAFRVIGESDIKVK
jgi:outer membrane protein OmpA-like peptidoglycan-associated protein/tetratricopeptide (TPR) repeat protein